MSNIWLICLFLTSLCVLGDYCAKTQRPLIALSLWMFNSVAWIVLYSKHNLPLAITGAFYSIFYYVGVALMGAYIFHEKIGPLTGVGIVLGGFAVGLIATGK